MKLSALAALLILLAVSGCEGPMGPMGPMGPRGPAGHVDEGTFIRVGHMTRALYDGLGRIIVEDRRISPTSYRGVYIRVSLDDRGYTAFYKPFPIFDISITEGRLIVHDDVFSLINYRDHLKGFSLTNEGVRTASFENAEFVLMVLVAN